MSQSPVTAKFLNGSIMRHILVMSTTSAVGLVGVFLVDLLDMFFLSLLGKDEILAGVGFAATVSFFTVSLSIGITISMAALVSRMIGMGNPDQARRYVVNVAIVALIVTSILSLSVWFVVESLLGLLGATGETQAIGVSYLRILLPSLPVMAVGMALSAALRGVGDARLAMYTTLAGGFVNAVLDPIFIFWMDWGVEGAAAASVISRFFLLAIAFYGVHVKHKLLGRFNRLYFLEDLRPIFAIAGPAMLTNVVTPLGNAIVIMAIAQFGEGYVAGFAIIGRLAPVVFALVFSLSGAVAPIIGQNYGAHQYSRVQQTLIDGLKFSTLYVCAVSVLLYFIQDILIQAFNLSGDAAAMMRLFCTWLAISFVFNGAQFISNAAFNNLGKPMWSTGFNAGKATLGTLPFVYFGGMIAGANGVLIGQALGSFIFGSAGVWVALRLVKKIASRGDGLSQ